MGLIDAMQNNKTLIKWTYPKNVNNISEENLKIRNKLNAINKQLSFLTNDQNIYEHILINSNKRNEN